MHVSLTPKQQAVLQAIEEMIRIEGRPPSYKELQEKLGYSSTASIWRFVSSLKKKGLILEKSRQWHSLLPQKTTPLATHLDELLQVEIIGHIFRDKPPVLWMKSASIQLPAALLRNKPGCYGLIIEDASYLDLHLLPHDLVVVDPQAEIVPGELVLASNKETIIGHLFEEGELLQFRSSPYSTKTLPEKRSSIMQDDVHIWGVIIASIRAPQLIQNG